MLKHLYTRNSTVYYYFGIHKVHFTKNFILTIMTNSYASVRNRNTLKSNYFPTISAMMIANYTSFILYHVQVKPRKKKMLEFVTNSKNPDKQFPKTTHGGSLPTIILLDITITSVISQHSQQIRIVI